METDTESLEIPKTFTLDLEEIRQKTVSSYEGLQEERPEVLPNLEFAYSFYWGDFEITPQIKALIDNVHKLTTINGIYTPAFPGKLLDFEKEYIDQAVKDMSGLGIPVTHGNIISPLTSDPAYQDIKNQYLTVPENLMQIAQDLQQEYVRVALATRIFEGTRKILDEKAPAIPKPKKDTIYHFRSSNDRGGGWTNRDNGGHILSVENYTYDIQSTLEALRKEELIPSEYYDENYVIAAHELAHAAFAEMYSEETIKQVLSASRKNGANLSRVINEGYAMLNDNLMIEILEEMSPDLPETRSVNLLSSWERKYFLKVSADDSKLKVYLDGYKMTRRIIWQLGLYNASKEEQIVGIASFFKDVDLEKASTIIPHDESYIEMLKDPLHKLPLVKKADSNES